MLDGPYSNDAQEAFTFISGKTKQSDVVVFFKPRALHLFTKRPSVTLAYPRALELGDYLLVDINLPRDWNQVSPNRHKRWQPMASWTWYFKMRPIACIMSIIRIVI